MAETLGMLCDKITIVKLKEYHTEDQEKLEKLNTQSLQLQQEIDEYIEAALQDNIPIEKIKFESNKVYNAQNNPTRLFGGKIGYLVSSLATINCELWHEQEKVFDFEKVIDEEKNAVVKKLAILNLERNQCIDKINEEFYNYLKK
jgi:hypothetical protein